MRYAIPRNSPIRCSGGFFMEYKLGIVEFL